MFGRKKEVAWLQYVIEAREAALEHERAKNETQAELLRDLISAHQELQAAALANLEAQIANRFNSIYDNLDYLSDLEIEIDLLSDAVDRYLYGDGERVVAQLRLHESS